MARNVEKRRELYAAYLMKNPTVSRLTRIAIVQADDAFAT